MKRTGQLRTVAAAAILIGAASNAYRWVRRLGARRRHVDLRMTVVVEKPITEVFEFCRDFENFPRIVEIPLEVEDFQDGRSHWRVPTRAGRPTEWDASVTKYVPNSVIAWESDPGSPVRAAGTMRFAPLSPEESRIDIVLTYAPLSTNLGEAIHAIVKGGNTKRLRGAVSAASRELSRAESV